MIIARLSVLLPLLSFAGYRPLSFPLHAPTGLRLTVGTLHAASLTAPRAAGDSVDGPYILVSILGPKKNARVLHLPDSGHLRINRDEALGARPVADLSLEPGDTVRVLISVLEGRKSEDFAERTAAVTSTIALTQPDSTRVRTISSALSSVIAKNGSHWLGSATLLLTNEGGTTYWRALECVATCKVLSGADASPFAAPGGAPVAGVVELSGSGGTYHMQLNAQRTP
jgi:hypothetical protein